MENVWCTLNTDPKRHNVGSCPNQYDQTLVLDTVVLTKTLTCDVLLNTAYWSTCIQQYHRVEQVVHIELEQSEDQPGVSTGVVSRGDGMLCKGGR